MCPKMFIWAFKDIYPVQMHPCMHSDMYIYTHKQVLTIGQNTLLTVITGSEITLQFFNLIE